MEDGSFLNYVQNVAHAPIDFVSTHLYPTDGNVPHVRTAFEDMINATASYVAGRGGLPTVITEFSAGLDIAVYDEPYAAAFIVHAAFAFLTMPHVKTLSYWTFTDIFEEVRAGTNLTH